MKKNRLGIAVLVVVAGSLGACGGEEAAGGGTASLKPQLPPSAIELESTQGCLLDVDCAEGLFCFQRQCTWECEADEDCRVGATCSQNGRCVLPASLRPSKNPLAPELDEEGFADVAGQRQMAYMEAVQRAQLLQGRALALEDRLNQLENLIASPSVIFAFANRLARAESRVERAKGLLYDWLVALEYYAVRPFVNQRLAIMLARNPSQLEAIANELLRLQRVCGGMITYETVDLSLRDDLLRGGFDMRQAEEEGFVTAAERFRAVLAKGNVPVDTQVRYSTDENIGDVIANRSVLAATFDLRLDDFANLAFTCNAKIASIDVHLVGEELGEHVRPTVSILYDGTSTMRSCQPNIQAIVGALSPGSTSFGSRTTFRTAGRSVSPVARIGEFGEPGTANRGLEGLPLASRYTIMIDPEKGENERVNWAALDDVMIRLTYVYQDMFPEGQCE